MRVCIDCPKLIPAGTRCTDCARTKERARGTRQERGYNAAHDQLRRQYQRRMDRGEPFTCWRCTDPIDPEHWHLGHDDNDRAKYRGPECPACNLASRTTGRISPNG